MLGAADAELLFGTVDAVAQADAADGPARRRPPRRLRPRRLPLLRRPRGPPARPDGRADAAERPGGAALTPDADERLADQARRVPPATVTHLLDLLADGLRAMKDGADARTQLELALVKAADPARDASHEGAARPPRAPRARRAGRPRRLPKRPEAARRPPPAALFAKPPSQPAVTTDRDAHRRARDRRRRRGRDAAPPEAEPAVAVAVAPVDAVDELRELWPAVLEQLEGSLKAMLGETVPLGVEDEPPDRRVQRVGDADVPPRRQARQPRGGRRRRPRRHRPRAARQATSCARTTSSRRTPTSRCRCPSTSSSTG